MRSITRAEVVGCFFKVRETEVFPGSLEAIVQVSFYMRRKCRQALCISAGSLSWELLYWENVRYGGMECLKMHSGPLLEFAKEAFPLRIAFIIWSTSRGARDLELCLVFIFFSSWTSFCSGHLHIQRSQLWGTISISGSGFIICVYLNRNNNERKLVKDVIN